MLGGPGVLESMIIDCRSPSVGCPTIAHVLTGPASHSRTTNHRAFFIFIFFNFVFYKNIFLFSKFTEIYPGRPTAGRQGLFYKKFRRKFASGSLEDRSPRSGAAGPPGQPAAGRLDLAARLRGDHLSFPSKRPAPSFGSKISGKNTRFVVTLFIHHIMV